MEKDTVRILEEWVRDHQEQLLEEDRRTEEGHRQALAQLDGALSETATLLGRAQQARLAREQLEQVRAQRARQLPRVEQARAALDAQEDTAPRRQALAGQLAALAGQLPQVNLPETE